MNKVFRRTFSLRKHPAYANSQSAHACRHLSNEPKDDDDKSEKHPFQQIIRDKQQSVKEEKFFHDESKEQLKALKKSQTKKNKNETGDGN